MILVHCYTLLISSSVHVPIHDLIKLLPWAAATGGVAFY